MSDSDKKQGETPSEERDKPFVRRDFLKLSAYMSVVAVVGIYPEISNAAPNAGQKRSPIAKGYLVVDTKKCQGCVTCMLACSIANEGRENLSLSRIQVKQNPFAGFPDDISIFQCRQCADPKCVKSCPTGALIIDAKIGNMRTINEKKCVGCMKCVDACAFKPGRTIWNFEEGKAVKCDLCTTAQFFDPPKGPFGKQACVEACPLGAIALIIRMPAQEGNQGYAANLRGPGWGKLGYTTD